MKDGPEFREPVRVVMHLDGGFTKVVLDGGGGANWDIPTAIIPVHLRAIGSRFLLAGRFQRPEPLDTGEDIRAALRYPVVQELDVSD